MHIRLATLADCSATASLSVPACHNDELFVWMNPRRAEYPEHFRYSFLIRHQTRLWAPGHVFYVAETDEEDKDWTGESQVTGFAIWQRRGESDAARSWRKQSLRSHLEFQLLGWMEWYHDFIKADKSVDYARRQEFQDSGAERFNDINDMWKLRNLCVDPAFQRRGVGGMLIEWGQKQATLEACPVCLTASMVGQQLYRKKGFRQYGNSPCEGFQDVPMFIWEPESTEGWWGMKDDGKIKGEPEGKHTEELF